MAYIFDTSKGETPEIVAQRRKMADALAARIFGRTPQNVGEGLSALGQAWIAGTMRDEADAAQKAGQAAGNESFSKLFGGASQAPAAPQEAPVSTPMGSNSIPVGKEEFVSTLMPLAQDASAKTGVDPRIIVAQAALESGWGKSAPGNNLFGIKSHGQPGGNVLPTTEVVNGQPVRTTDSFRAYNSPADSVSGYADFINKNPRYSELKSAPDLESQVAALGKSGYATDPNYAAKVGSIARGLPAPDGTKVAQAQPATPPSTGPDLNTLIQASTNPWLSESQRTVVNTMLQQKLKEQQLATDPLHQLQIKKAEADLQYGKNPESVREYEYAKGQGFEGTFQDWIATKRAGAGEYGLTPIWGTGPDNKPALIQLGKNGKPMMPQLPDGFSIARDPIKVEGPTGTSILDPQTRQVIQFIPKDVRGAAREHVIGDSQGKIQSTLPSDILSANQTVTQIDQLLGNEGLDAIVGPLDQFRPSWTLGAKGRDALARFNQLKGKAFLQAYSTLRGGGAITEVEGVKAENAMARMDRAQSEDDFRAALKDFRDAVSVGLEKLKEKGGVAPNATGAQPPPGNPGSNTTSGGVKWSVE